MKHQRAIWGLTRSLLANAVEGVSTGYTLSLRLVGVGYRATLEEIPSASAQLPPSQRLNLKLGFAHPVLIDLPADVVASTPSTTNIVLAGIDKQRLGEVAARIRRWRQPEPYNVGSARRLVLVTVPSAKPLLPVRRGKAYSLGTRWFVERRSSGSREAIVPG